MTGGKPFYITTPIYYVNDSPHLGHAYTTVACDALARFMRLDGRDVLFLTGTDEHGQKVDKSARDAGMAPLEFCDRVSQNFRDMTELMDISNDAVHPHHRAAPRHGKPGDLAGDRGQQIAQGPRQHLSRQISPAGTRCATRRSTARIELVKGADGARRAHRAPRSNGWKSRAISSGCPPGRTRFWPITTRIPTSSRRKSRRNEVMSFVKGGLNDLSVSRTSFTWGVPVPGNPKHVMYVWLDALTNYLTAIGLSRHEAADFKTFWPADLHVVGKDIVRFPLRLLAGFSDGRRARAAQARLRPWLVDGRRPEDVQVARQLRGAPATGRTIRRRRGALFHAARVAVRHGRRFLAPRRGRPHQRRPRQRFRQSGAARAVDDQAQLRRQAAGAGRAQARPTRRCWPPRAALPAKCAAEFAEHAFHRALETIWQVVGDANRYVDEQAPWALRKTDPARMGTVLYIAGRNHTPSRHPDAALRAGRRRRNFSTSCRSRRANAISPRSSTH